MPESEPKQEKLYDDWMPPQDLNYAALFQSLRERNFSREEIKEYYYSNGWLRYNLVTGQKHCTREEVDKFEKLLKNREEMIFKRNGNQGLKLYEAAFTELIEEAYQKLSRSQQQELILEIQKTIEDKGLREKNKVAVICAIKLAGDIKAEELLPLVVERYFDFVVPEVSPPPTLTMGSKDAVDAFFQADPSTHTLALMETKRAKVFVEYVASHDLSDEVLANKVRWMIQSAEGGVQEARQAIQKYIEAGNYWTDVDARVRLDKLLKLFEENK